MPFTPFHEYFPELAARETRSLTVPAGSPFGLPAGEYGFLELYCDEPGCDCRRVLFYVIAKDRMGIQAVIGWGSGGRRFLPTVAPPREPLRGDGSRRAPLSTRAAPIPASAPPWWNWCETQFLTDPAYVERIKSHYAMVREKIDRPRKPGKRRPKKQR